MNNPHILVVDDDNSHRTMLATLLAGWGYNVSDADDGDTAVTRVSEEAFDLVLMDIRMARMSGLEAQERIHDLNPAIPVIIMTAYSSVETAIKALKKGAWDYLTKPLDFDELRLKIGQAVEHNSLREENRLLKEMLGEQFDSRNIIAKNPAMIALLETTSRTAASEATVLITGESGSGKEMIAGAIHFNSPRKLAPFVKINCAAITETLLESELFGHEKGSFTGAIRRREGRFRQADGGSIFLDEVSEMSLNMQAKLLRVLQEREFTRVGGEETLHVDVRIIAATNKNLAEEVAEGRFREDLYYRLNVIPLSLPPLRRRREDIPLLAEHFLARFAAQNHKDLAELSPRAMDRLIRHDWPGNVRELMNTIERAVVLCQGDRLEEADILLPGAPPAAPLPDSGSLEDVERQAILTTLEATAGNKSEAARRLGITRMTLNKKLKHYGMME